MCGVSRRSGEKPQGRNMLVAWQRSTERRRQRRRGEHAQLTCRTVSTTRTNLKRGGQHYGIFGYLRRVQCDGWRSKGDTKLTKVAHNVQFEHACEDCTGKSPEGPFGNEKRPRGTATTAKDVATACSQLEKARSSDPADSSRTLKGGSTSQELSLLRK
jgi:hypothetical protein